MVLSFQKPYMYYLMNGYKLLKIVYVFILYDYLFPIILFYIAVY